MSTLLAITPAPVKAQRKQSHNLLHQRASTCTKPDETLHHEWVLLAPQAVRWIAAGSEHMVAVTDTAVHSWGSNGMGQLGLGHFREQQQPAEILSLHGHKAR